MNYVSYMRECEWESELAAGAMSPAPRSTGSMIHRLCAAAPSCGLHLLCLSPLSRWLSSIPRIRASTLSLPSPHSSEHIPQTRNLDPKRIETKLRFAIARAHTRIP